MILIFFLIISIILNTCLECILPDEVDLTKILDYEAIKVVELTPTETIYPLYQMDKFKRK
jgi:hypothetical protein